MFEIRTISHKAPDAPAGFTRSLRETGFAVLTDHPIAPERMRAVYDAWAGFFASGHKHDFLASPERQDGYFPFRAEHAKDSPIADLKEFYHVYPDGRLPEELAPETRALHDDLVALGRELLGWIEENSPAEVRARFTEPLPRMLDGSTMNLLRILHYPPQDAAPEPGAIRAAAHEDINLITLLLAGSEPGLEARDSRGEWHAVPCDPGMMAINIGDMLQMASGGFYPSTSHRVVNPPARRNVSRYSMPMFLHPRPEVVLDKGVTADDYLQERLREIGLKS